jgi:hypothetical protein
MRSEAGRFLFGMGRATAFPWCKGAVSGFRPKTLKMRKFCGLESGSATDLATDCASALEFRNGFAPARIFCRHTELWRSSCALE